ncbi:MAG: hypothetical protein ACE5JB_09595, partial [bacterium]
MKLLIVQLLIFLIFALSLDSFANNDKKDKSNGKAVLYEIEVHRNGKAPKLDGILSKFEWKNAAVIFNFTQKEPTEGQPASEPTFILITYDNKNIYFGIRCFDKEPEKIVANEMRRDYDLSDNDYVEIIIDTFHDQRN